MFHVIDHLDDLIDFSPCIDPQRWGNMTNGCLISNQSSVQVSWCHGCRTQLLLLIAEASLGCSWLAWLESHFINLRLFWLHVVWRHLHSVNLILTVIMFSSSLSLHFFSNLHIFFLWPSIYQGGKNAGTLTKTCGRPFECPITDSTESHWLADCSWNAVVNFLKSGKNVETPQRQKAKVVLSQAEKQARSSEIIIHEVQFSAGTSTGIWSQRKHLTASRNCFRSVLTCENEKEKLWSEQQLLVYDRLQQMFTQEGFTETNQ